MDHFDYVDGGAGGDAAVTLHCEDVAVERIAAATGTPCYVYSHATLTDHYDRLVEAFADVDPLVCFSIKSCGNLGVCRVLGERGAGMDLVSGGELHRAVAAGVDPARCVYAGAGKTDREIVEALHAGVGWFNVESEQEFETIATLAAREGVTCRTALRVNPDVDPHTHRYTTTGRKRTKFGVDIDRAADFFGRYGGDERCLLRGLHLHIGSPVYRIEPYVEALTRALALADELAAAGTAIEMLDLGGGFGADYESGQSPSAADYAERLVPLLRGRVEQGLQVVLEPGRSVAANAGVLLVRVLFVKQSGDRRFAICDGGMNVLLRPSHYEAFHFIWPCRVGPAHVPPRRARELDLPGLEEVDVVGPICETGDFLGLERRLPPVARGDLLAVFGTGAYGMTMASRYNSTTLPPEVLVRGDSVTLVRERETYDDLVRHELRPSPVSLDPFPVTPASPTRCSP